MGTTRSNVRFRQVTHAIRLTYGVLGSGATRRLTHGAPLLARLVLMCFKALGGGASDLGESRKIISCRKLALLAFECLDTSGGGTSSGGYGSAIVVTSKVATPVDSARG